MHKYDIRPLRRYYKVDESLIDKLAAHDLCYIYQEYQLRKGMPDQVDKYYLFAADAAAIIGLEKQDTHSIMKAVCYPLKD